MATDYSVCELQQPLYDNMAPTGTRYYVKAEPECCWFCMKTTVSRGWGMPPIVESRETCTDWLINVFASPCLLGNRRQTVSGLVTGNIYGNPVLNSATLHTSGMSDVVAVDSRLETRFINAAWKSWCMRWVFTTSGGTTDYFVANGETGQEVLGIQRGPAYETHTCCCLFVPYLLCCNRWCLGNVLTGCPGGQSATTKVVGDRKTPGGAPEVGTLTTGMERNCCCPIRVGGVINVPQELDANSLMSWVLLWRTSLAHHYYKNHYRTAVMTNWTEKPMSKIEEMV